MIDSAALPKWTIVRTRRPEFRYAFKDRVEFSLSLKSEFGAKIQRRLDPSFSPSLNENEPRPEVAVPDCPPELGPVARREWDRLVGDLAALRILTNLDRAALAAYCGAYALWAEATEAIQKYGAMIKSPTGYPVQSPYLAIANRQAEIMMRRPSSASRRRAVVGSLRRQSTSHHYLMV